MRGGVADDVGVVAVGAHGTDPDDPDVAVLDDLDGGWPGFGHGRAAGERRARAFPAEPADDPAGAGTAREGARRGGCWAPSARIAALCARLAAW